MTQQIKWTKKALKQLLKITPPIRERLVEAARSLENMPDVKNIKALKRHQYGYRMRVGDYRILFDWHDAIKVVEIEEVKKRDERTY
ncbi:type II toxin-antitoxin system RelE family toxin [Carnimonas bestiolae]|uniref:type II toxin-antitoxin system RelE family toxin n=1 Tax=Carnimonas bestiolae TaxID=3402172 RepID=UPI003EDBC2FA